MTYQVDTLCHQPPRYYSYVGPDKRQYDVIYQMALQRVQDHEAVCPTCRKLRSDDGRSIRRSLVKQIRK